MAKSFKFSVVTPNRVFYEDEVEMVIFNTANGEMGVMANHVPMLVANKPCILTIEKDKEKKYAFISEGFIQITSDKVSAILDDAQWADEIDIEKAVETKKMPEESLIDEKQDLQMKSELKASIERASNKIKTAKK